MRALLSTAQIICLQIFDCGKDIGVLECIRKPAEPSKLRRLLGWCVPRPCIPSEREQCEPDCQLLHNTSAAQGLLTFRLRLCHRDLMESQGRLIAVMGDEVKHAWF